VKRKKEKLNKQEKKQKKKKFEVSQWEEVTKQTRRKICK